ncbi:hypothetical protein MMC29_007961 [Sticta canariensis]|nr:hypothetical protein [Sticta canariensis]
MGIHGTELILHHAGAGESGKSTILKQMRIIYAEGFHLEERKEVRQVIFSNMIVAFKIIAEEMRELGVEYENKESYEYERVISAAEDIGVEESFPIQCLTAMKALWTDEAVQSTIRRGNEYALHDNIQYYYANIDRLFTKDYIPNDQDVLRSRLRTTGITETLFELGQLNYHMFDVGGQRSERKKWVHCFEGVHCLMFVAALSGYDQCLVEDKTANQMQEALILFESIMSLTWFKRSSIILFLNKIDLFKEKLAEKPVRDYFPDYTGGNEDYNAAAKYFANKFRGLNRTEDREIYVHFTNATDTNLLTITMKSVQDTIIQSNLTTLILSSRQLAPAHQRKHSSSKPSSSPKDASSVITTPSETPAKGAKSAVKGRTEHGTSSRASRRKSKDITHGADKGRNEALLNMPSVPSTQSLRPQDIHLASFFSIHRPISVTTLVPPPSNPAAFSAIFAPRSYQKSRSTDVNYTINSAGETIENANAHSQQQSQPATLEDADLHHAVLSSSHADPSRQQMVHINVEELAKSFRHFHPPPPPTAQAPAWKMPPKNRAIKQISYSTVLTIVESTHPNGLQTYRHSTTPFRENSVEYPELGFPNGAAGMSPSLLPRQPFLNHMRERHLRWKKIRWEKFCKGKVVRPKIWTAISVRRQRKLKMKKHKYKKLMRRTRNLRRKLDRG